MRNRAGRAKFTLVRTDDSLAMAFRAARKTSPAAPVDGGADVLEEALAALFRRAKVERPGLTLGPREFVVYVAARVPETPDVVAALGALHAGDLYLACACAQGDAQALAAFDEQILREVPRYVLHIVRGADFGDAVRQELRDKLFVAGPEGRPKVLEYDGRGPLGGWVRVAAVRTALNERRRRDRARARDAKDVAPLRASADPEIELLKKRYASELSDAFARTVDALPVDMRNVLRMHYLDGLTLDQVAAAYGVHRSSAARWIADARRSIVEQVKARLRERLRATPSEVESVLRLVRSQLDASIQQLFGAAVE